MEIVVDNVNVGLSEGLRLLDNHGIEETSRNGSVIVAPTPVMTTYKFPCERVLFSPLRDANPFFHFFESLWMLAGRADIQFPSQFAKNIANFSDDGNTMNGAYGFRWRYWFGYDQLPRLLEELRTKPNTRRAVLTMWDGKEDLRYALSGGKDAPCNTHAYFGIREGALEMTVCCRSNDIWWGCYGANAVHFSMLQEYVASHLGLVCGHYRQFSNNFHIYTNIVAKGKFGEAALDARENDLYSKAMVSYLPLLQPGEGMAHWDKDLTQYFSDGSTTLHFRTSFFTHVVRPMYDAWAAHKERDYNKAINAAEQILASDWRIACVNWLGVRIQRQHTKKQALENAL